MNAVRVGVFSMLLLFIIDQWDASRSTFINSKMIPVKSIKSPDGDIIDCIKIDEQPAFDHPLLKNHTIQMTPSYYPKGLSAASNANQITQLWQLKGSCPEGTIPIRRTDEKDIIKYGKKQPSQLISPLGPIPRSQYEHSIAYVWQPEIKYRGATGNINAWQPEVQNMGEFSGAQIWIVAGPFEDFNSIEAGLHVFPTLYQDNNTRVFVYWTGNGYKSTGCFNLVCPGFVQTTTKVALGATITPISTYHGPQYEARYFIWKDPGTNAWWLNVQNIFVGYWPSSLFTHLADSASLVEWGGEIINNTPDGQHTKTQMGNGHFPGEGLTGASYFSNLLVVNESFPMIPPPEDQLKTKSEFPNCYDISLSRFGESGYRFFFGGPGRNIFCP